MIKILDFATTSQGAYRLLRKRVSEFQKKSDFSNLIACPPGEEVELMRAEGLEVIEVPISRSLNPLLLPKEIKAFMQVLNKIHPDIVHSHNSKAGGVARLAVHMHNRRKKNKQVVIIHQVHGFVFARFKRLKRFVFVWLEKFLSRLTDYLLFQNETELQFAEQAKFDTHAQLVKIGNGISFSELNSYQRQHVPIPEINSPYQIVCVARLEPVKNQMMLLQALNLLKEKYQLHSFLCTFIGEGDSEQYEKFISSHNLQHNVKFPGKMTREQVVRHYENAHLNVLTSLTEGMPRALMEAIYLGVPSIGTDVIGTNEVIKPGISGELVAPGDVQGLAEKIFLLLTDHKRREQLIESGKKYALIHFDEKQVIKKLQTIYIDSQNI